MRYKTMKKSGVDISAITVGTWAIGGANSLGASYGEVDDAEPIRAIQAMIDGGVRKKERRENKGLVDEISATIILQDYMNSKKR